MKKFYFVLIAVFALLMVGCKERNTPTTDNPGEQPDPEPVVVPTSFARKQLIDHFTGEACPQCPPAMNSIQKLVDDNPGKYIWISHHYGYKNDEYTITESRTIGTKLGVEGAPMMSINRTKRSVKGTKAYCCHPGYLDDGMVPLKDADTSLVQVLIDHSFDAATRQLMVCVHGLTVDASATGYKVSVLVKESNLIGPQQDVYFSWEGWTEFRHVNTVRDFLTNALGDAVTVTEAEGVRSYTTDTLTFTVPQAWNENNCMVVAYVTSSTATDYTVLNAEQVALVDGTDGGEQYIYEGITPVPVSETYPEEGAPLQNIAFTNASVNTQNLSTGGYVILTLQAPNIKVSASGYSCYPYLQLYVFTRTATLEGTYPVVGVDAYDYGAVAGGYRNDEEFELGGSMLYYVYNYSGSLYPMAQWLVSGGELVVGADGSYTLNATTLNGSTFTATYSKTVAAPARNCAEEIPMLWKRAEKYGVCLPEAIR